MAARSGASAVAYLAGDQQGTDSVAVDAGTLGVTRRYFDPYGKPRGTAPPSFPSGEKSFVGGAADAATGLIDLGAREYQPGTGSFVSPDPLLKPYNPQTLNAYAYSADNPSTYSDPSGASPIPVSGDGGYGPSPCTGSSCTDPKPKPKGTTKPPVIQISPHVYVAANDPQLKKLRAAWQ